MGTILVARSVMRSAKEFWPSLEEMRNFEEYIESIEGALQETGVGVVHSPVLDGKATESREAWWEAAGARTFERLMTDEAAPVTRLRPVGQYVTGAGGVYRVEHDEQRAVGLGRFVGDAGRAFEEQVAAYFGGRRGAPESVDASWGVEDARKRVHAVGHENAMNVASLEEVERKFWKELAAGPSAQYGSDILGSLVSLTRDRTVWDVSDLRSLLSRHYGHLDMPGITRAYLYFGAWKSAFTLHTEDMDLHSINYLHFGSPKVWYGIAPADAERVRRLAASLYPEEAGACTQALRHKFALLSPRLLSRHGINVHRLVQKPGDYVISMPAAFHFGFNSGFNCAESVNFATSSWLPFAFKSSSCSCNPQVVHLDLSPFLPNNPDETEDDQR